MPNLYPSQQFMEPVIILGSNASYKHTNMFLYKPNEIGNVFRDNVADRVKIFYFAVALHFLNSSITVTE